MTSDHLDDETLSASLDGETTAAELAHLDGCDRCQRRVEQLHRAARLVGGPVAAPDGERREATIRAAVAAAPTVLATRRRGMPQWLAAAAALLVFAAFGTLLLQAAGGGSGSDDEDTAASSFDAESAPAEESAGRDAASGGGNATESAPAPASAPDPGSASLTGGDVGSLDGDLLRGVVERRLRAMERDAAADDSATSTAAAPCEAELRAGSPPLGAVRFVGRGTLEGAAAMLVVFDELDQGAVLAFAVTPGCSVLRTESVPAP